MARKRSDRDKPTQKTKPKKGDPVEIPVPTKRDVFRDLKKIAKSQARGDADSDERSESSEF